MTRRRRQKKKKGEINKPPPLLGQLSGERVGWFRWNIFHSEEKDTFWPLLSPSLDLLHQDFFFFFYEGKRRWGKFDSSRCLASTSLSFWLANTNVKVAHDDDDVPLFTRNSHPPDGIKQKKVDAKRRGETFFKMQRSTPSHLFFRGIGWAGHFAYSPHFGLIEAIGSISDLGGGKITNVVSA